MTLKIKDKKNILTKLYFRQFYIPRKLELQGFLWIKDLDPVFSQIRIRIRVTHKERIRADPQLWSELTITQRDYSSSIYLPFCLRVCAFFVPYNKLI